MLSFIAVNAHAQVPVNLDFYLNNSQVSQTAKDFYHGKFKAEDSKKTLSIIDSLYTRSDVIRPFYLYLVSKMMNGSDGALAEVLGNAAKEFIERKPNQAIEFLYSRQIDAQKFVID